MKKNPGLWSKIFEKHEDHPEVKPWGDFGPSWPIWLIGLPILLAIAFVYWLIAR
jgi:hypothetical protein